MNHNITLLDELIANFRDLRDKQEGDDLTHILLEYVDPDICNGSVVHFKKRPREWQHAAVLESTSRAFRTDKSIYESIIVPYNGEEKILPDWNIKAEGLPDRFVSLRKKLIDNIEIAGRELRRRRDEINLPPEILRQPKPSESWLFFLHYCIQPERIAWKRVNQVLALGTIFGLIPNPEDIIEDPDTLPLDTEQHDLAGNFSFKPLSQNSFSKIRDIANESIEALYLIKEGKIPEDPDACVNPAITKNACEQKYTISEAHKALSLSYSRFNDYRKSAGVETSGKRGYKMPESDLQKIATHIVESSSIDTMKEVIISCQRFLDAIKND